MTKKNLSWLLSVLLFFSVTYGCATGDSVKSLRPGMSQAQVISVMGNPDGYQQSGNSVALKYANRLMSGWSWDRTDYFVLLTDDKVTQWGNGVVRERKVGQIHSLFLYSR